MSKKVKKLMIVLFGFLILFIIMLIVSQNRQKKVNVVEEKLEYINSEEWQDEIYPEGMPKLVRKYQGELSAKNMGKSIYYFATDVIPNYHNKLKTANLSEISAFYASNKKKIAVETGIETEQDFLDLITLIQELNTNKLVFDSFRVDSNQINFTDEFTEIELYVTYQQNSEIKFHLKIHQEEQEEANSVVFTK